MNYLYAAKTSDEFEQLRGSASWITGPMDRFLTILKERYSVYELPNAVVLASAETATQLLSKIPVPAYTNEYRTVFCPHPENWRAIYLRQLDSGDYPEVRQYYESCITENHVLQILGHEFVHHSDLFLDEVYEKARWFEEGMCEYISRKYFLTDKEFREEARINALLVKYFEHTHGSQTLDAFCSKVYDESLASVFYFYWKSYVTVERIVRHFSGDLSSVFRAYRQWFASEPSLSLFEWFQQFIPLE